eukprot:289850_1
MSEQWECGLCTLKNDSNTLRCTICNKRKPRNSAVSQRKRTLQQTDVSEPCFKRMKLSMSHNGDNSNNYNKKKKNRKKKKKTKTKRKKKKKAKNISNKKSYLQMIFEAIINNSNCERNTINGVTKSKIINYIKQNNSNYIITKDELDIFNSLIISSIQDAINRGVLVNGAITGRYKITNLGIKEIKQKHIHKKEKQKQKIESKYIAKYYNSKHCKFDDELNEKVINSMNATTLQKNLKYRGLQVGGKKIELKQRLKDYLKNPKTFKQQESAKRKQIRLERKEKLQCKDCRHYKKNIDNELICVNCDNDYRECEEGCGEIFHIDNGQQCCDCECVWCDGCAPKFAPANYGQRCYECAVGACCYHWCILCNDNCENSSDHECEYRLCELCRETYCESCQSDFKICSGCDYVLCHKCNKSKNVIKYCSNCNEERCDQCLEQNNEHIKHIKLAFLMGTNGLLGSQSSIFVFNQNADVNLYKKIFSFL